jgi:hypothetical protein
MAKLKDYNQVQIEKGAVLPKPKIKSGVGCTDFKTKSGLVEEKYRETKGKDKGKIKFRKVKGMVKTKEPCGGEMLIHEPEISHPEYANLKRASCGKCGWRGWV